MLLLGAIARYQKIKYNLSKSTCTHTIAFNTRRHTTAIDSPGLSRTKITHLKGPYCHMPNKRADDPLHSETLYEIIAKCSMDAKYKHKRKTIRGMEQMHVACAARTIYIYICIYIYVCVCIRVYIYIYRHDR